MVGRSTTATTTLLLVVMAAATAHAGPTPDGWITTDGVSIFGLADGAGQISLSHLIGDATDAQIRLSAPYAQVQAEHHQEELYVFADGSPTFDGDTLPTTREEQVLHGPMISMVEGQTDARFYIRSSAEATLQMAMPRQLLPTSDDGEGNGNIEVTVPGETGILDGFRTLPDQHLSLHGKTATLTIEGPFTIGFRGLHLRAAHADGISDLDAIQTISAYGGSQDRIVRRTFTDYVLEAPAGSSLEITWRDVASLYASALTLDLNDGLGFESTTNILTGETQDNLRLDGAQRIVASHVDTDTGPGIQILFDEAAPGSSVAGTITGMSKTAPVWALVAVAATAAVTGSIVLTHRIRSRGSPRAASTPSVPASPGVADEPAPVKDLFTHGIDLFNKGDLAGALEPLRTSIDDHQNDHEARYALGVCLLRAGHFKEAFGHLRFAVRKNPIYLQLLVTGTETEGVREDKRFETFMRQEARVFRTDQAVSELAYC